MPKYLPRTSDGAEHTGWRRRNTRGDHYKDYTRKLESRALSYRTTPRRKPWVTSARWQENMAANCALSKHILHTLIWPKEPLATLRNEQPGSKSRLKALANYGINVGSMAVTWAMRFVYGKIELWTGKALASAHRQQRREARAW